MTTQDDYKKVLTEATRKRCLTELKLTGTTTMFQAAALEEDDTRTTQLRAEIHALQDIVLDCISTQMFCISKINE